ncbi:hypothetical protein ACFQUX_28650 [Pantoea stewartii]
MMKKLLAFGLLAATTAFAEAPVVHSYGCGSFRLDVIANSMSKVNGEYVTSQKIRALGEHGMQMQMTLMPASDGNDYGFEYVHPDGSDSHFLNVELIRTNMDQPRLIGTFPCQRIAG